MDNEPRTIGISVKKREKPIAALHLTVLWTIQLWETKRMVVANQDIEVGAGRTSEVSSKAG